MKPLVTSFYICLILEVILLREVGAIVGSTTNSTFAPNRNLNSWDVPHSGVVCDSGWTLYKPTQTCFRSFPSAFVQQSAVHVCTSESSSLAAVSQQELQYLMGLALVGENVPQRWWMGYEMRRTGDSNFSSWELVDLSGQKGDLSWLDLDPPGEHEWVDKTKICVAVTLYGKTVPVVPPWKVELQSCTDEAGFLCTKDALLVCIDRKGTEIHEGSQYIPPGHDACTRCYCFKGKPDMCLTTMCAKPPCELYRPDPEECCQYICTDGDNDDQSLDVSDNLRWVLTMLTSLILLGMMLFMVYRMRQKRIAYLRYRAQQIHGDSLADFEPGTGPPPVPNLDDIDGAVFREPPPPYSFLKEERHIPLEQPPPYISTVTLPMDVNRNRGRHCVFQQDSDAVALLDGSVSSEPNTPTLVTNVPPILPSPPEYTSSTENSTVSSPQTEQSTPGGNSTVTSTPTHQVTLPSINTTV